MLRTWIIEEGNALIEIPPVPSGYSFTACLTHDIDFVGIRNHKFDHTMLGFLYRSTVVAAGKLLKGKTTLPRVLQTWRAALSLPLVYLGWAKDFWEPFEWYLKAEKDLPATYFLIPFKHIAGDQVPGPHASRRATAYDIADLLDQVACLQKHGCELGVHGIDAWHSVEKGRAELDRVRNVTGRSNTGIGRGRFCLRLDGWLQRDGRLSQWDNASLSAAGCPDASGTPHAYPGWGLVLS
jgi:hypothetical protein